MRKRAGLARALVLDPEIILFDEPDSGLDPVRTAYLNQLIVDLNSQIEATFLIVTHDINTARTAPDKIGLLYHRHLAMFGATFDAHVTEVTPALASPFKEQFTTVATTDIKPMAVKNGATVQAKVYEAGVMDATGDGAEGSTIRVLAFVNQATTTIVQKTPAIDQNRVIATMRKVGDRWLVSDLAAF